MAPVFLAWIDSKYSRSRAALGPVSAVLGPVS